MLISLPLLTVALNTYQCLISICLLFLAPDGTAESHVVHYITYLHVQSVSRFFLINSWCTFVYPKQHKNILPNT